MKSFFVFITTIFVMYGIPLMIHERMPSVRSYHYYSVDSTRSMDNLFKWCCNAITYLAQKGNVSYEEMNIYIFIIWQPYLILLFAFLYITKKPENI